ncbi:MAG: hypothetical protein WD942_11945, partial [Dehalococcoidia bacterium]
MNRQRTRLGLLLLGVTISGGGCGTSPEVLPWTVTDSAGVSIVMSSAPEWADEPRLSDAPGTQILSEESDSAQILHQVVGVELLADGRILVANRGDGSVRLYDEAGHLVSRDIHFYALGGHPVLRT